MAHKPKSFKVNEEKKTIILYTNVQPEGEQTLIDYYLRNGYAPMFEEKKGTSVATMRKELRNDEEASAKFEEAYKQKNGFFAACKVYSEWKKAQPKDKKKK